MNNIPQKTNIDTSWSEPSIKLPKTTPQTPGTAVESEKILDPFEEAEKKANPTPITQKNQPLAPPIQPFPPGTAKPGIIPEKIIPKESAFSKTLPVSESLNAPTPIKPLETKEKIEPKPKPPLWKTVLKTLGLFIGVFVFIYLFVNFPTIYDKIAFAISPPHDVNLIEVPKTEISIEKSVYQTTPQQIHSSFFEFAVRQPIKYVPPSPEPTPTQEPAPSEPTNSGREGGGGSSTVGDNILIIPRLGKKIPVVWNSPPDEGVMLENLQHGVVHYAGTALPGEGKGPIFISGHSSYFLADPGKYKRVFANLDRMQVGDKMQITYNGNIYTYEVYETVVVNPDQVDVLNQTSEPTLFLMTCVPVGTNKQRLIVKSKQI